MKSTKDSIKDIAKHRVETNARKLRTLGLLSTLLIAIPAASNAASFWNQAPTSGNASSYSGSGGDCSADVQKVQSQMQQLTVNEQISLAQQIYPYSNQSYKQLSCLDNLLGGGLDIIFNPPSLSSIVSMLLNAVCNVARNEINTEIGQVTSQFSNLGGGLGGGSLSQILPGVNLGSVVGGVGVGYGAGSSSGNLVGLGNTSGSNSTIINMSTRYSSGINSSVITNGSNLNLSNGLLGQ